MVEATIWRAEGAIDLILEAVCSNLVDLFSTGQVVHIEERVTEANVVD